MFGELSAALLRVQSSNWLCELACMQAIAIAVGRAGKLIEVSKLNMLLVSVQVGLTNDDVEADAEYM